MPNNRTLNILRFAAAEHPSQLATAIDQCQEAACPEQEETAYAALRRLLQNTSGHLPSRTDLGDAFQSHDNRQIKKSIRLSRTMIQNTVMAVKQAVRSGTIETLKASLGLPRLAALSPLQIPTRKERRGLNEVASTLLARPARVEFQRTSHVPSVAIVLTTNEYPYNSRDANVKAAQAMLREVTSELPQDHIFRRFAVKVVAGSQLVL